ncbi:MAG: hypothetical protein Q9201_000587 [Fulgogasparrea decipioides]
MRSWTLFKPAAIAACLVMINAQATQSSEPVIDTSDIEDVIPTQILSPAKATSIAVVADSFIASVTAAPEFSSVVSVLATGVPVTAQEAIEADPFGLLVDLVKGSPLPPWLPPSVGEFIQSVAEDTAQIVTSDFGMLYTSVSSEVAALPTGTAASSGFVFPTGSYVRSNSTGPRPTGSAAAPSSIPQAFPSGASSLNARELAMAVVVAGVAAGALLIV